jgi:predicted DNA-binding WGR domain protein
MILATISGASTPLTRRFEYVAGSSSKYWAITMIENRLVVHHGRIGTRGTFSTTPYPSVQATQAAKRDRISEKEGKGYKEVPAKPDDTPLELERIMPAVVPMTPLGAVQNVPKRISVYDRATGRYQGEVGYQAARPKAPTGTIYTAADAANPDRLPVSTGRILTESNGAKVRYTGPEPEPQKPQHDEDDLGYDAWS